jgi:hypothetical protein
MRKMSSHRGSKILSNEAGEIMEIKNTVNSKIDWNAEGSAKHNDNESALDARKHYFRMLRCFLSEVESIGGKKVREIFKKYNVHLVDIDDFPRVNIDEPKGA